MMSKVEEATVAHVAAMRTLARELDALKSAQAAAERSNRIANQDASRVSEARAKCNAAEAQVRKLSGDIMGAIEEELREEQRAAIDAREESAQ